MIVKFLETIYHHVPNFKQAVSSSQDFIEALAATLFPPPLTVISEEEDEVCSSTTVIANLNHA